MSDRMRPIPFERLVSWILTERKTESSVFGVRKTFQKKDENKLSLFSEKLETPFGPAAGPHTQLAQNIIAAYVAGSRFFELKTVQTLDGEDLPVAKPCINANDECYNVEWSTELTVPEAYSEYVKAWFALKLISREWELGSDDGFIFNMSVGYDLKGIQSEKIDTFIEGLKNAENTEIWKECTDYALTHLSLFKKVDKEFIRSISPKICTSITLSTLHGCPPQEIERIATYLITEKKLNTFIKCNPTLLGYEFARRTMDSMGYGYLVFDDHHFKDDLQFSDAVPMIQRLLALGKENGLAFGVKLTNTFPVGIAQNELPGEEMYMSGRSLFPLTISLAEKLSEAFDGKLRISFSGGADAYNSKQLFTMGIWPITLATTVLKPGGYERMVQIADELNACAYKPFERVDLKALREFAADAVKNPHYRKQEKPLPSRKLREEVPLIDCFTAPCRGGCPIHQDIPAYLHLAEKGEYLESLRVITDRNPLPFITGTICSHKCMEKCTRNFYESPVDIRAVKLESAQNAHQRLLKELEKPKITTASKAAVVGGGAAGLSAAYFLARSGFEVTVFEKSERLGGIVRNVIPGFRISDQAIENDIALVRAMGAELVTGCEKTSVQELCEEGFEYVVLATGAWVPGELRLEYGEAMNVLEFLQEFRRDPKAVRLGRNVVIVGGGNTAMDGARAAKRVPGVEKVSLVYRRTKRYMPADEDELQFAVEDGVEFCELLSPIGVENGVLKCYKMELGERDASGRRTPVQTEEIVEVSADTVIAAVGEKVDTAFYAANGIAVDERGRAKVNNATLETSMPKVYVAGDGLHGPATVVEAIADAAKCAEAITETRKHRYEALNINENYDEVRAKKGILSNGGKHGQEGARCLECASVCENCVDVCPNRANISVRVPGMPMAQIIHVDGMCNECGNCATFCPYSSAPYRDKFTLFGTQADFNDSKNQGFLCLDNFKGLFRVRLNGVVDDFLLDGDDGLHGDIRALIAATYRNYEYLFYQTII
jgi:putative selenate reductase